MEVWARPRRPAAGFSSAKPAPAMSLLFSLAAAASAAGQGGGGGGGGGGAGTSSGLNLALAAPPILGVYSGGGAAGAGVPPGDAVRLALRLSAGQAGDRDAVTEVRPCRPAAGCLPYAGFGPRNTWWDEAARKIGEEDRWENAWMLRRPQGLVSCFPRWVFGKQSPGIVVRSMLEKFITPLPFSPAGDGDAP